MPTLPIAPMKLPTDLRGQLNGQLDDGLLTLCGIGNFKMHNLASRALRALMAAYEPLTEAATGTYRTYAQQVALFNARYTTTMIPGRPTKVWNGTVFWQLPNTAMAAVPGTSNHGLGLAIDFSTGMARYAEFVAWLCIHAKTFGYSAETQSESWHWRYVAGDQLPQAVIDFETPTPQPEPPTPLPPSGDDDMPKNVYYTNAEARIWDNVPWPPKAIKYRLQDNGVPLRVDGEEIGDREGINPNTVTETFGIPKSNQRLDSLGTKNSK